MKTANSKKTVLTVAAIAAIALVALGSGAAAVSTNHMVFATTATTKTIVIDSSTCPAYQSYSTGATVTIGGLVFDVKDAGSFGTSNGLVTFGPGVQVYSPLSQLVNGVGGSGYTALSYVNLSGVTDKSKACFGRSSADGKSINYNQVTDGSDSITISDPLWYYYNGQSTNVTFKSITMSYSCVA
jgi:hypothetical protein